MVHRCKENENSLITREKEGKQYQGFKEVMCTCSYLLGAVITKQLVASL